MAASLNNITSKTELGSEINRQALVSADESLEDLYEKDVIEPGKTILLGFWYDLNRHSRFLMERESAGQYICKILFSRQEEEEPRSFRFLYQGELYHGSKILTIDETLFQALHSKSSV